MIMLASLLAIVILLPFVFRKYKLLFHKDKNVRLAYVYDRFKLSVTLLILFAVVPFLLTVIFNAFG